MSEATSQRAFQRGGGVGRGSLSSRSGSKVKRRDLLERVTCDLGGSMGKRTDGHDLCRSC